HHATRGHLAWGVGCPIDVIGTGGVMAVRAVEPQGCAHDSHGPHEVVHRDSLERLNVLECLLRQHPPRTRRLPGRLGMQPGGGTCPDKAQGDDDRPVANDFRYGELHPEYPRDSEYPRDPTASEKKGGIIREPTTLA